MPGLTHHTSHGLQEILNKAWPEMVNLAAKSHGSSRMSPLVKAMREAKPRVEAWQGLDALHTAAAPGSGRAPRALSSGEVGMTDTAVLRLLVDAAVVSSSADLDARLVRAALSEGVTSEAIVPSNFRVLPRQYILSMFPGSQTLAAGQDADPEVAAGLVRSTASSSWGVGRIPGGSGLLLTTSLQTAFAQNMAARCTRLLTAAQDAAKADKAEGGDDDETSEGGDDDAMDVDLAGEDGKGDSDSAMQDAAPAAGGVDRAGAPGDAPPSAGAGSGFYSCESSEEQPRPAGGGQAGGARLAEADASALQPRALSLGDVKMNAAKRPQGKIDRFFRMPVGAGRAKSLHCVTPMADGQDKENVATSALA